MVALTMISYKLNDEVSVAKRNNNRKKLRKTPPNGICAKACGSTMNNNPGPSVGSNPNVNTTGKMANPAKSDTKMFIATTQPAE